MAPPERSGMPYGLRRDRVSLAGPTSRSGATGTTVWSSLEDLARAEGQIQRIEPALRQTLASPRRLLATRKPLLLFLLSG